ncbi:MAG TPA: hypothetical protein VGI89_11945 [Rhizomicrobium sp.]
MPLEGDQSWREQDARRIFSGRGEDQINHGEALPAEEAAEANDALPKPGFEAPKALGIVLPLSLATFVVVLAVTLSMPEILTASFWNNTQTKRAPEVAIAPVSMADAAPLTPVVHEAAQSKLRPSLAEGARPVARPVGTTDKAKALPGRQIAQAAPSVTASTMGQAQQKVRAKRGRLPPIGETYFASRAHTTRTASADWKVEAAKWDESAAQIRARRETRVRDSSEFP